MITQGSSAPTRRHYTALARLVSSFRKRGTNASQAAASRQWQIRKNRRGQEAWEIYTLAVLVSVIAIAASFQQASQHLPFTGWHWLWIAPVAAVAGFVVLQLTAVAAAVLGSLLGSCGFMPNSTPGSRTSFFFLSTLTAHAAWAATAGTWLAPLGYLWLALVALNIVASVWLAMREHENRH